MKLQRHRTAAASLLATLALCAGAAADSTFSNPTNTPLALDVQVVGEVKNKDTKVSSFAPNWSGTVTVQEENVAFFADKVTINWTVTHAGSGKSWSDSLYATTKKMANGNYQLSKAKTLAHSSTEKDEYEALLTYTVKGSNLWFGFSLAGTHSTTSTTCSPADATVHLNVAPVVRFSSTGSVVSDCLVTHPLTPEWLGHLAIGKHETINGTSNDEIDVSWSVFHLLTGEFWADSMNASTVTSLPGVHLATKETTLAHANPLHGTDLYDARLTWTVLPNGTEISTYSFDLAGTHEPIMGFLGIVPSSTAVPIGSALYSIDDVDFDGYPDLVAGSPLANGGVGAIVVQSGALGHELLVVDGAAAGDAYGFAVASAGDVNGDGVGDVLAGAPRPGGVGYVDVISGADGSILLHRSGVLMGDGFGAAVAGGSDLNGDGVPDFLVGAPDQIPAGAIHAFSGASGAHLFSLGGLDAGGKLGATIAALGDVNGDGVPDLAVGAPGSSKVWVASGALGTTLLLIAGASDGLGAALAACGDVNGDGFADLIAGAPLFDGAAGVDSGAARIYSGQDGSVLLAVDGAAAGARLGAAVAALGDADGDGFADLAVGAPGAAAGSVTVYSGVGSPTAGAAILSFAGDASGDEFGAAIAGLGDVDGDDLGDVLVGAPGSDESGPGSGQAILLRATNEPPKPGSGEDMLLLTGVLGSTSATTVKHATQFDPIKIELQSPGGTFATGPAYLLLELIDSNDEPGANPIFVSPILAGIHVDLARAFLIPVYLPANGSLSLALPLPGYVPGSILNAGKTLLVQAVAVSPSAQNGLFAATDLHEIRLY